MKNKNIVNLWKCPLFLLGILFLMVSCEDNLEDSKSLSLEELYGKYSEEIIVYDKDGLGSITLTLFAHDRSLLSNYLKHDFALQNPNDPFEEKYMEEDETSDPIVDYGTIDEKMVVTIVASNINLSDDYSSGYQLSILTEDDDSRGWSYSLFSSVQTGAQKWSLRRTSYWHAVYLNYSQVRDWAGNISKVKPGFKLNDGQTTCREWDSYSTFAYWEVMVMHRANRHIVFTWTQFATYPEACDIPFN